MLKALIILTLVLGSASLLLWAVAGERPVAQRARREPAVSGRVVGTIRAPLALAAFHGRDGGGRAPTGKVAKTDAEWKAELGEMAYKVTRCSATEAPFTGKYWDHHEKGTYACVACGQELFRSDTKYDSGSGWPSYFQPAAPGAVLEHEDTTLGMVRVEVRCSRCDSHLGHVFPDGPRPTGMRYCINSAALDFRPQAGAE